MAGAYERLKRQVEGHTPPEPDDEFRKQAPHMAKLIDMVRKQDAHDRDGGDDGGSAPPAPCM